MTKLKNLRIRLYNENPICPFCAVKMILPEEIGFNLTLDGNGKVKQALKEEVDHLCTIEHLYSRLNPLRHAPETRQVKRRIICCKKCNNARGHAEERALGKEELRRRSMRGQEEKVILSGFKPESAESKSAVVIFTL